MNSYGLNCTIRAFQLFSPPKAKVLGYNEAGLNAGFLIPNSAKFV